MIRALFLDLDGTLVHSEPVAARALTEVLLRYGQRLDPRDADFVIGRTWMSALKMIEERLGLPASPEQILPEVLDLYRSRLKTEVPEVPGASEVLGELASEFELAVISGSFREEIEMALEGIGLRQQIRLILGAEDYPMSKPAPDGYSLALTKLGLAPQQALVFEDSEAGIASALAAGLQVVAVRHCASVPDHSPWVIRAHHRIQDWRQVSAGWIRSLSLINE